MPYAGTDLSGRGCGPVYRQLEDVPPDPKLTWVGEWEQGVCHSEAGSKYGIAAVLTS